MAESNIYRASTTAPVNIAVIKYWGKRDPSLNLPTNSSLSVTLSQSDLRTHTTASCSASYKAADSLLLNNSPQTLDTPRSKACLASLRALRAELEASNPTLPTLSKYPLNIVSVNNFPTAAGLASSAAGFAALIRAIADLYQLPQSPEQLSLIARQGSGSACRSLLGGYVAWDAGSEKDGSDSKARLVAPREHWPEMKALILVASAEQKDVSSTSGMQTTTATSELFQTRAETIVPQRMKAMEKAIAARDFEAFAKLTTRDSNGFHACCLDTDPPIFYLNDVSRAAIAVVNFVNRTAGETVAAYTFDAGPNAVVYYLEKDGQKVEGTFRSILGDTEGWKGDAQEQVVDVADVSRAAEVLKRGISRVIQTSVGEGPISVTDHLIDESGKAINA